MAKLESLDSEYKLSRLIHTIAHEVAHCLLGDYSLDLFQSHGGFHNGTYNLTRKLSLNYPRGSRIRKITKKQKELK